MPLFWWDFFRNSQCSSHSPWLYPHNTMPGDVGILYFSFWIYWCLRSWGVSPSVASNEELYDLWYQNQQTPRTKVLFQGQSYVCLLLLIGGPSNFLDSIRKLCCQRSALREESEWGWWVGEKTSLLLCLKVAPATKYNFLQAPVGLRLVL